MAKKAKKKEVEETKVEKVSTPKKSVLINEYRRNPNGSVDVVNGAETISLDAEFVNENGIKRGDYLEINSKGKVSYKK
jgi:hypothetical protein